MRKRVSQHHMSGLLMLLLFGVFAVCVLAVLLTGARAYRGLTQRDQAAFDRRTGTQYIAARVRQADTAGGVAVKPFGDTTALALSQDGMVTWVYWHDGYLMELYTFEDAGLSPEDGVPIMELESLELTMEDGLLTARVENTPGATDTIRLSLRCGEGAAG